MNLLAFVLNARRAPHRACCSLVCTGSMLPRGKKAGWALFCALVAVLLCSVRVEAAKKRGRRGPAFEDYFRSMEKARDGLVDLEDDDFVDLIVSPGSQRSFPVLIIFTVSSSRFQCHACPDAEAAVSQAAQSYIMQNKRRPFSKDQQLVFAKVVYDKSPQTFHKMALESVPNVFIFKADTTAELPPPDSLRVGWNVHDPASLLRGIEQHIGLSIAPIPDTVFTINIAVALAVMAALLIYLVVDQWEVTKSLLWHPWIWRLVSLSVYAFGVGGMVYCIIRSPPLLQPRGDGIVQLFNTHSTNEQFVLEGVVMGMTNLLCGMCFVAAFGMARPSFPRPVQFIGTNIFLALGVHLLCRVFSLYEGKVRWYRLQTILHPGVADFIFTDVKKGSGFVKRLVRLSWIWLYKYKDWPTFKRTVKNILLKFVIRKVKGGQ